jgi:sugar phosphate isomerase/epimerase
MVVLSSLMSRRAFVISGGATAIALAAACGHQTNLSADQTFDWGLQLYMLGDELEEAFEERLLEISTMGYHKVEIAGLLGRPVQEWSAALSRANLKATSAHVPSFSDSGGKSLETHLDEMIEQSSMLGVRYMTVPLFHIPHRLRKMKAGEARRPFLVRAGHAMTLEDWKANAAFLNKCGEAILDAGMQLAYHNHNVEFANVGSVNGMEVLLSETDPDLVCFELDVAWLAAAGYEPVEFMQQYPGRFRLMHVKDVQGVVSPNTSLQIDTTSVGSGILPWPEILQAASEAGVSEFFVEQEPPFATTRISAAEQSIRYLKSLQVRPAKPRASNPHHVVVP